MLYGPEWNDPDYPPGFEWVYGVLVLAIIVVGILFLTGCSGPQPNFGDVIGNHCASTAYTKNTPFEASRYNEEMFHKCMNDSIFTLDALQKGM